MHRIALGLPLEAGTKSYFRHAEIPLAAPSVSLITIRIKLHTHISIS